MCHFGFRCLPMQSSQPPEPELEPTASIAEGPRPPCVGDCLLSDILAFVDTFPIDSDRLLDENAGSGGGAQAAAAPQSKEERRREANRLKDRNKYLRKKVGERLPAPHTMHYRLPSFVLYLTGPWLTLCQEKIPKLQAEVEELTKTLATYEDGRTPRPATAVDASLTDKQQQLVLLSQQKNKLQVENAQLRKQFHWAAVLSTNLQQMLNNEHKLYLANSSYFLVLKPLTPPDCQRELKRSLSTILPSHGAAQSRYRAREICGWNEKRLTAQSDFHNVKSKLLRGKSARFVYNQTWEVFMDPFRTEKLFAPVMNVRCRLVQRVDDDNVLFCYDHAASRVLSEKTDLPSVSTMALVTRVTTETGHLIITRGLRRGRVEVEDLLRSPAKELRREVWLETLTWCGLSN
jgi:hypothetical protein